jgi:hypothetical protein
VRKARRWSPAAAEREQITAHLFYEVQMTFFLAGHLNTPAGSRVDVSLRNAHVEAFTIHLRQLIDFFWGERQRRGGERDAFAADFYPEGQWARLRPELPAVLDKALCDRSDWGITELTYGRGSVGPAANVWDVVTQAFALAPAVRRFADTVDHAQFTPGYVNGMKLCAEMFLDGNRGSLPSARGAADIAA